MPAKGKSFKKKLRVTHQRVLKSWTNTKGGANTTETHLYAVTAVDENGEEVKEPLRSFSELELGVLIEYEIEPYERPGKDKSWTVKKPRSNTTARVAELEKRVNELSDRLAAVEERIPEVNAKGGF